MSNPKMLYPSIHQLHKNLNESKRLLNNIESRLNQLQEDNEQLRSKAYKDNELSRLQELNKELFLSSRRGFPVSKDEHDAIDAWMENHLSEHHPDYFTSQGSYFSAIGGNWIYTFIPTSIGTIGSISCHSCKSNNKPPEEYEYTFQNI